MNTINIKPPIKDMAIPLHKYLNEQDEYISIIKSVTDDIIKSNRRKSIAILKDSMKKLELAMRK